MSAQVQGTSEIDCNQQRPASVVPSCGHDTAEIIASRTTVLVAIPRRRRNDGGLSPMRGDLAELPLGYRGGTHKCPKCGSRNLSGVIITGTADAADPNIICLDCYYWWD